MRYLPRNKHRRTLLSLDRLSHSHVLGGENRRTKKELFADHFRVPFTEWSAVFAKIEAHFFNGGHPAYQFRNWGERVLERPVFRSLDRTDLREVIIDLDPTTNYWAVIVSKDSPTAHQYLYDCRPDALLDLLSMAPASFFIGEKKYRWLVYFRVDQKENKIALINVDGSPTPLDGV